MSKASLLTKAATIRTRLDKGLIRGKMKRVRARQYIAHLKWKAKQPEKSTKRSRARKHAFNPAQGMLPQFLPQMSVVRIEELVADKIFRQMAGKRITASVQKAFKSKGVQSAIKDFTRASKKKSA